MGPPAVGSAQPFSRGSGGVGLGMLAMAGEMAMEDAETEKEKEARERYVATRKLSYNALRDQASAEREGEM